MRMRRQAGTTKATATAGAAMAMAFGAMSAFEKRVGGKRAVPAMLGVGGDDGATAAAPRTDPSRPASAVRYMHATSLAHCSWPRGQHSEPSAARSCAADAGVDGQRSGQRCWCWCWCCAGVGGQQGSREGRPFATM
jgi:hypothetical protein